MSENEFPLTITIGVNVARDKVLISFGPLDPGDVAYLVEHIARNCDTFKRDLVEHVADALLTPPSQDTVT